MNQMGVGTLKGDEPIGHGGNEIGQLRDREGNPGKAQQYALPRQLHVLGDWLPAASTERERWEAAPPTPGTEAGNQDGFTQPGKEALKCRARRVLERNLDFLGNDPVLT